MLLYSNGNEKRKVYIRKSLYNTMKKTTQKKGDITINELLKKDVLLISEQLDKYYDKPTIIKFLSSELKRKIGKLF